MQASIAVYSSTHQLGGITDDCGGIMNSGSSMTDSSNSVIVDEDDCTVKT